MYDRSNAGVFLRKFTCMSFAWWHAYKWTVKMVMKIFAPDFIAMYYHYFHPDSVYSYDKIRLSGHATYLTYMRLAYPNIRVQLQAALATPRLITRQRVLLTNMKDMFEFFIPAVTLSDGLVIIDSFFFSMK